MKRFHPLFIQSLPLVLAGYACTTDVPDEKPNIVWITSEDNSKHYMKLFDENGIETPNIEALASHGLIFTHAFSNAPVCSAARSTLISGCYGPRIASHYHRKLQMVPMPEGVRMFPAYLRDAGYYTTNCYKEDYNIIKADDVWDESSRDASWKNRQQDQPFFHVFNIHTTHESRLHFTKEQMDTTQTITNPESFSIQPNHPQTELFRYTNAYYRDKVRQMDQEVGEVVKELDDAGMLENTFIFYFADHGGVLPGSKGYIYETGLHVPFVVHIPEKYKHLIDAEIGSKVDGFVSFVDFGATVLSLAGVEVPEGMDGKPFLGREVKMKEVNERDETFGYAGRFDEKYDMIRTLRKGKYKYMRSYQPFNFDGLMNNYRYKQLAYQQWWDLFREGELDRIQSFFYQPRAPEELFDVEADPYETRNLAEDPAYEEKLKEMWARLNNRLEKMPDLSFYPEFYLVNNAFDNPVLFGQTHQDQIKKYIEIADLSLLRYEEAKPGIEESLNAEDPWERYWGLIVCSCFGKDALDFIAKAEQMSENDPELIIRVRAAEFLGLIDIEDPSQVMTSSLYNSNDPAEALLILNSIVLMRDMTEGYDIQVDIDKVNRAVSENGEVGRRLEYLGNR